MVMPTHTAILLLLLLLACQLQCAAAAKPAKPRPPNVVLLLTDDEDVVLGGFGMGGASAADPEQPPTQPLPRAVHALRDQGMIIQHWYAHTPVCCPSRAEILTGRMFHNLARHPTDRWDTDAHGHPEQCMHINVSALSPGPTFAEALGGAGYRVGFFGKYLNLSPRETPTGTHTYLVNPGPSAKSARDQTGEYYPQFWYSNSASDVGGKRVFNGTRYETHIIADVVTQWLREGAAEARAANAPPAPFFLYTAPHSPHGAAIPEPKYSGVFGSAAKAPASPRVRAPVTPSWNVSGADHHWLVAQQPPVTAEEVAHSDTMFARRWECLLSYDDLVGTIVAEVGALGERDNTWFFLTSDHGFHFHELRLGVGKWNVSTKSIPGGAVRRWSISTSRVHLRVPPQSY